MPCPKFRRHLIAVVVVEEGAEPPPAAMWSLLRQHKRARTRRQRSRERSAARTGRLRPDLSTTHTHTHTLHCSGFRLVNIYWSCTDSKGKFCKAILTYDAISVFYFNRSDTNLFNINCTEKCDCFYILNIGVNWLQ